MEHTLIKIFEKLKKDKFDFKSLEYTYFMCLESMKNNVETGVTFLVKLARLCEKFVSQADISVEDIRKLYSLYKKVLLSAAPHNFDSYLLYLEWNRDHEKKFYPPRRSILKPLVDDLQDLNDGKIDFLGISLPPRVGKSTLCILFLTWRMGKYPNDANVMSGHSDKLTDGFYREVLSIITDNNEYLWSNIFPSVKFAGTSAKNETIDLDKTKRFSTLTCRSISGTLTGAVEVGKNGILYSDDLIEDLEESLNPARLDAKYDAYLNQLKDRKKDGAKELMVGTRWNVFDPLGRIQDQYEGNSRYRFRIIPALNEKGESNFNYAYGEGFSTEYYFDMKDSIDDATWNAKYMGNPYIREGLLFPEDSLLTYNGVLPDGDPTKVAVCDVAWGGGDSLAMPFAYIYGSDVYIHDAIFNTGDKTVTYPVVIGRTKQHMPHKERFEANNGGHEYADHVDAELRKAGVHINIYSKAAPSNQSKLARIIQYAPDIKRFYFLAEKYRSPEYRAFMRELTLFVQTGKNAHDDAPDSLAMLSDELYHGRIGKAEPMKRPF
jgi:predicted phage terminase large subunit-like protein